MNVRFKVTLLSIVLGLFIWIIDSCVDYMFFIDETSGSFELIPDSPIELYMRIVILIMFALFGFILGNIIAKKERITEKLRESETRFKEVAENAQEWIWEVDQNGMYTFASPTVKNLLGFSPEELVGKKFFYDLFIEEEKQNTKELAFLKFNKKEQFHGFINKNVHKNGNTVWLSTSGLPIIGKSRKLLGYRGTDYDITSQKLIENSLKALSTIFAASTSTDFFNQVSKHISETLLMDYVFIGELQNGIEEIKVLGGFGKGEILNTLEYKLADTPCENVIDKKLCCYPDGVQNLFPKDELLKNMGIEGYIGAPIFTKNGDPLGILVVLNTKPIKNPEIIEPIFRIFNERVSSEIERMKSELELLKKETELKESEVKHRTLLENLQQKIFYKNLNSEYMLCNKNFAKDLNMSPDEIEGKTDYDLFPQKLAGKYRADDLRIFSSGLTEEYQEKYLQYNQEFWVNTVKTPVKDDAGNITGLIGIFWDITQRKQIEEALKRSEKKFRGLVENMGEGVGIVDLNNQFTFANPTLGKIFGGGKDYLIGKSLSQFVDEETLELFHKETKLRQKGKTSRYEFTIKSGDNTKRILSITASPQLDDNGDLIGTFGIIQDITDRKKNEEELKLYKEELEKKVIERTEELDQLNKKLAKELIMQKEAEIAIKNALSKEQELNEMKSHFVSMVSHEFRTPLTSILASADLLEMYGRKWEINKYNEHIGKIQNSVLDMKHMLEEVLTLSKVEQGKIQFNPQYINFEQLCRNVVETAKSTIDDSFCIKIQYSAQEKFYFLDELLFKMILDNLIVNAIKFSPLGGKINVSVSNEKDLLILQITDEGIGISEKELPHIFNPFTRGEEVNNISGSGLGLAIVKEAVTLHNGEISAVSKKNKWSKFIIKIPIQS